MKKYLVIDDTGVDTFTTVCDTLEEVNSDSCLNCPHLDSACDGADVLSTMPLEHWAEWVNKRKKIEE